jgi:two-component system, OmpR family, response regulator RegX3
VALATDGPQALNEHACFDPHLVLLDLTVHSLGGLELFKKLNASQPRSGIILLTENCRKAEGVEGLRLGADDFLTKPVSFDELFAHITAVLRRVRADAESLVLGSLHIDFTRYAARRGQESISMSTREIDVLRYMKERAGRIVGRDDLLRKVWGYQDLPLTRCVDHLIYRLRRKVEPNPAYPQYILSVYADGYRLVIPKKVARTDGF